MKARVSKQGEAKAVTATPKPAKANGPARPTLEELLARIRPGQAHGEVD